jgi:hypothetical protein
MTNLIKLGLLWIIGTLGSLHSGKLFYVRVSGFNYSILEVWLLFENN